MSVRDQDVGSLAQRIVLFLTHVPIVFAIYSLLQLQKRFQYRRNIYVPMIFFLVMVTIDSVAHHLCGDVEAQHLEGYNFCLTDARTLLFADQVTATSVVNILAMYGPDVEHHPWVKAGWMVTFLVNACVAYADPSDSIRYTWSAFVIVVISMGVRVGVLHGRGMLGIWFEHHVNVVNFFAGLFCMGIAYGLKAFGDSGEYYTWGHGGWQILSLGPGTYFWVTMSQMETSLVFWKRKRKSDGKYYADCANESPFYKYPGGECPAHVSVPLAELVIDALATPEALQQLLNKLRNTVTHEGLKGKSPEPPPSVELVQALKAAGEIADSATDGDIAASVDGRVYAPLPVDGETTRRLLPQVSGRRIGPQPIGRRWSKLDDDRAA